MYEWLQRLFGGGKTDKSEVVSAAPEAPVAKPGVTPASVVSSQGNPVKTSAANIATTASTKPSSPGTPGKGADGAYGASWDQRNEANANFNDWLFEINNDADFSTNPVEDEILDSLDKMVKSKQSCVNLVKRLPGLVPQLLQSLRTENFSGADLSRKIAHDPVLVAAVIRLANSSANSLSKNIASIEHAVLILGQAGLRQLITGVAFRPIIDLNSGNFTKNVAPRIWAQSERSALACRLLAQERGLD
jgi:HDOD domain